MINLFLIENFEVIKKIKIKFKRNFDYKGERERCKLLNSYKYVIYVLPVYKYYIICGSLAPFFFFSLIFVLFYLILKKSDYYFTKIL